MKITDETRVKDILPEGYTLASVHTGKEKDDETEKLFLVIKKKVMSFSDLVEEYFTTSQDDDSVGEKMSDYLMETDREELIELLLTGAYHSVPFEIKLGLLKFICKERDVGFVSSFDLIAEGAFNIVSSSLSVPVEFVESIQ